MSTSQLRRGLITALVLLVTPALVSAQQAGTITGSVREAGTDRPLANARVSVPGTNLVVPTREDGTFTLRGVPAGTQEVQAIALGHASQRRTVQVAPAGTASVTFALALAPVQLAEVVTTATGTQRRIEVGNDIAQINAEELVATRPIANVIDLLTARTPGVQVLPGTTTGTQGRVRIRGSSSLSLSNDPIYIIDGIRMESATASSVISIGGAIPSRISDIDPEQIEKIEVAKGPSAATLYGTDAANGVVVITTKRGQVGRARWNTYIERGTLTDRNDYPIAYTLWGHSPGLTAPRQCTLAQLSAATCIRDSVNTFNLWEDPETTPLADGDRQQLGVQVSGGSDLLRYFLSGEYEEEIGVYKVPAFDITRFANLGLGIPFEHMRPNALERSSFRANTNSAFSDKADIAVSAAYIALSQRRPQTDNNTTGLMSSALGGPGFRNNGNGSLGFPLNGYRIFTPGDMFQDVVTQDVTRFIGSASPNWRPFGWLATRGNFGIDFTNRVDSELCKRGNCSDFSTWREGFRFQYRTSFHQYTADASAVASLQLAPWLNSKTATGYQYFRRTFTRNGAEGLNLPPGTQTVTAAAVQSADEVTTYNITAGGFLEQSFAFADRFFLTAAVRADKNTAFGQAFGTIWYPKASASWVVSDESFFPTLGFLNQLRLRAAFGESGVSPGANDALRFFAGRTLNAADAGFAAIAFSAVGNPDLRPERAREFEGGFDLALLDNRVSLELTGYNKKTKDALISVILPGSIGVGTGTLANPGAAATRFENIGSTQNKGWEAALRAQLVQTRLLAADFGFNYSVNDNKILTLPDGLPIFVGATYQHREGYQPFAFWHTRIKSFADANNDGIITQNEVVVSDTAEFSGRALPRTEWSFNPGVDLWGGVVRLTANFDHKGGHHLYNNTERIRCQSRNNCRGLADQTAPLAEQARVVALRDHPRRTQGGYIEPADYTKLRELALTLSPDSRWFANLTERARLNRVSLTFAARNLKTWTDYTGIDPESAYFEGGAGNDIQQDFQTAPPPRYYTLRLNLGF